MINNAPSIGDLKSFLGIEVSDTADDAALQEALDAALAAQCQIVKYPRDGFGDPIFTNDLVLAVMLRSQRYVARRNSPEGVVGLSLGAGDFVSARVASFDSDVMQLESAHRTLPVS